MVHDPRVQISRHQLRQLEREHFEQGDAYARFAEIKQAFEEAASQYSIVGFAGRGGMGAVFEAWDKSLARKVAVKAVLSRTHTEDAEWDDFYARFLREARMLAKVTHPCICQLYQSVRLNGRPFMIMEFIEGVTLSDFIEAQDVSLYSGTRMLRDCLKALALAHSRGVIHRDIKPDNIMVATDGEVKLTDFGLAKDFSKSGETLTQQGDWVGTPAYMSPEQIAPESTIGTGSIDHRCDLYSLGATFYHVLLGRPPFTGKSSMEIIVKQATMDLPAPDPKELNAELPDGICAILKRLLEKDRKKRYQSANQALDDVESYLNGDEVLTVSRVRHSSGRTKAPVPEEEEGADVPVAGLDSDDAKHKTRFTAAIKSLEKETLRAQGSKKLFYIQIALVIAIVILVAIIAFLLLK